MKDPLPVKQIFWLVLTFDCVYKPLGPLMFKTFCSFSFALKENEPKEKVPQSKPNGHHNISYCIYLKSFHLPTQWHRGHWSTPTVDSPLQP